MSEFKIPPISTLSGSTLGNYFKALGTGSISPAYYHKIFLTSLVSGFGFPFHLWENWKDRKLPLGSDSPLFIIGHWRSGTTFLHNLLCQDPNAGFVTTYQSLFPNNMHSQWLFKTFMKMNMPDKRPSDNVKLNVDYPQEDEFALGNMLAPSFYNFFYFPDQYAELIDETVLFKNKNREDLIEWEKVYRKLINKAQINTNGKYAIIKNPVNTARTDKLLEIYPKARLLHIYRNPVIVYLSTKKFFLSLFPTLQFQKTTPRQITDMIFDLYARIMRAYFEKKDMIPASQLLEISFEDFEKAPIDHAENIYKRLGIENWEKARPIFEKYLKDLGGYKKNRYQITREELDRIQSDWSFAFEELGYEVPDDLEVL